VLPRIRGRGGGGLFVVIVVEAVVLDMACWAAFWESIVACSATVYYEPDMMRSWIDEAHSLGCVDNCWSSVSLISALCLVLEIGWR
jgi:hypothetical protein